MDFDLVQARQLLQTGNLTKLFVEELGGEPAREKLVLRNGECDYTLTAVAQKCGFVTWVCEAPDGRMPDRATRLRLDRELAQTNFEHLIIFMNGDRTHQSWTWVKRAPNRPSAARTHEYRCDQPGDSLLQKLNHLFVSLEEEEKGVSIAQVTGRVKAAFDVEKITKAFYRDFNDHRKTFLGFIEGIVNVAEREWYSSVML